MGTQLGHEYGALESETHSAAQPIRLANAAIELQSVSLNVDGHPLYQDLSLRVREGEFLCVLGPSGCGKSTLLRLIGGLLKAHEGQVRVHGASPESAWKDLAYVFQSPRLVGWRNALRNVTLAGELRDARADRRQLERRARELLELVGLAGDAHKYPAQMSGGERQRVAIARALSVDPRIILMDEPFSALDINTRERLRAEILTIWRSTGKTIVFVTHDIDEAVLLADRVAVLSAKPTRLLEIVDIPAAHPRDISDTSDLAKVSVHLRRLIRGPQVVN